MRSPLKKIMNRIRTGHPAPGVLLESLDGELDAERDAKIKAHLAGCSLCRERLDQLQEGLQFFNRTVASSGPEFSVDEGLKQLTSAIRAHEFSLDNELQVKPEHKPSRAMYARLLSELSIYVGRRTAIQLLERCDQRDRLSAVIEPVISAFLGQHTGAAVLANVLRIWDRAQQVAS